MGYKNIIINNKVNLSYEHGYMLIEKDDINKVFLDDVDSIMINSLQVNITSYLINEVQKRNISLIFCNEKHNPSSQMLDINGNFNTYQRLMEQINYSNDLKNNLWALIVEQKILMQSKLIDLYFDEKDFLKDYLLNITPGDIYNNEAYAAKKYFQKIFGKDFNRRIDSTINSALNYGYAILLSMVNRVIISHGYNTSFGIKHHNASNSFNYSCDIIEPFRPLVDKIIINNSFRTEFDSEYKKIIIEELNGTIKYNNKSYKIENAINVFFLDVVKYLNYDINNIGEFEFDYQ